MYIYLRLLALVLELGFIVTCSSTPVPSATRAVAVGESSIPGGLLPLQLPGDPASGLSNSSGINTTSSPEISDPSDLLRADGFGVEKLSENTGFKRTPAETGRIYGGFQQLHGLTVCDNLIPRIVPNLAVLMQGYAVASTSPSNTLESADVRGGYDTLSANSVDSRAAVDSGIADGVLGDDASRYDAPLEGFYAGFRRR
ncbi:hypothetical protein EVG20_g7772 [Dentipellis fragilis]|uniref:Uncharacterized protein n=1 Tax=Dentipellis fragilis TaxID=205917 RepID=A0A4Y9YF41_9AGAM|nr:hypothetical protein EVG20_g7772 [Dentipellis fragilis]